MKRHNGVYIFPHDFNDWPYNRPALTCCHYKIVCFFTAHQHVQAINARNTTVLILNNLLIYYKFKFKDSEPKCDENSYSLR